MYSFKLKDFNPEWLGNRFFVCHLPTEIVIPNKDNDFTLPNLDAVYGYRLPREFSGPVQECMTIYDGKILKYKASSSKVIIEIHEDYGDDGHTNYVFRKEFIILDDDEVPQNTKDYLTLVRNFREWQRSERDKLPQQMRLIEQPSMKYYFDTNWY